MSDFIIRKGGSGDFQTLLDMFDEVVAWLAGRGSAGQWGTEPWSTIPKRVERVRGMVDGPGLYIAEIGGEAAGAIILGDRFPHVSPVDEPEIYLGLLLTSRRFTGHRVGSRLIEFALAEARERGIGLVRVDCWAGGDGDLQRYYESQGFKPTERFDVKGWIGQVFEQRPLI
ncbi:GNAT family N-acetyltransferase [Amycolatopsis thailandensis]|uniref:GNAT family N-acetyltransferase n=1 Tax=Amycolatopsis thailandensis TaxID=589330 RepID=A0A229SG77_9PSEU|nr:GNAT family N-acetyltransferase [Amycolatopsis thailandensis]OXM57845.1 GNAT family N-acetyltransferase [Amycolatopsis thailandensis]